MRAAFLPNQMSRDFNPYLDFLETALEKQGVEFEGDGSDYLSWRRLLRSRGMVDVFHFHWIQYHYRRRSWRASVVATVKFITQLVFARLLGYRIVWTLHNLLPHERPYPWLDWITRRAMAILATGVVTHCEEGRRLLRERLGRIHNVFVVPLGNYMGVHPDHITTRMARAKLGIDANQLIFLSFGLIRPYKGLDQLLTDFSALSLSGTSLWIVGTAPDEEYTAQLTARAVSMTNVRVVTEFVPDDEIQVYFRAADIVVLPFTQVLTSSSAILALSYSCPIIAPAMGCLPEVVTEGCGLLYDPQSPSGLRMALRQVQSLDLQEMGRRAYARAQELTWVDTARGTIQAYRA